MTTHTHGVKELLEAGLHFGHKTHKWNPKMKEFILGQKNSIHIIDLEKTADKLAKAAAFLEEAAAAGKIIMLVSTKQQTLDILPAIADKLGLPYVTEKWYGGLLTNWNTTKTRIRHLRKLKEERDLTGFSKYVKSERTGKQKEIERLEQWYMGIEGLERRPDVMFVLDTVRDKIAVLESNTCHIPVVGIVDTNADPDLVTYPIPGNDDAVKAIDYILTAISNAIERGIARRNKATTEKEAVKPAKA